MRKLKIAAVLLTVCALIGVYLSSAFAIGDGLAALGEYFGLSNPTSSNAENEDPDANDESPTLGNSQANLDSGLLAIIRSILGSAASALSNSQLTEILQNYDINSLISGDANVINEILDLIGANQPTTSGGSNDTPRTQTPTQQYTVPSYTNVYVTNAPSVTYSYTPGTTSPYMVTTTTAETTTLYYVAPSTLYAEQITTLPYDYQVDNGEVTEKDGVTLKTIIGISILLISGVAVVGVALSLKKSKV